MAFEFLKRKKEEPKKAEKKTEKKTEKKAEKKVKETALPLKNKKDDIAFRVLKNPHVTEKSTFLNERDQYVFKVFEKANKYEIKKAIENLYNVEVASVNIVHIGAKERRVGKTKGIKQGYKKAIVKLSKGKIEILER